MFQAHFNNDTLPANATQFGVSGGFVPSPAQEVGAGTKRFGGAKRQTLRAVTIKQIAEALEKSPDDNLRVDGEELQNILLVARVESAKQLSTTLELEIDDGTGSMEAKLYIDAEDAAAPAKAQECKVGSYVRIYGHLRPMDDKYPLVAFSVKAVTDFNEVTYHFLNCVYQHLHFTQASAGPQGTTPGKAVGAGHEEKFGGPSGAGAGFSADGLTHPDPKLNAVQQVLNAFKRDVSSEEVAQAMKGQYSLHEIQRMLAQLADYGIAYSTTHDHYCSCST